MTCEEKRTQILLYKVIERHYDFVEAIKSENKLIKKTAQKMLDINIFEMWALTQN